MMGKRSSGLGTPTGHYPAPEGQEKIAGGERSEPPDRHPKNRRGLAGAPERLAEMAVLAYNRTFDFHKFS